MTNTALMPEPPIKDMDELKVWLKDEYTDLTRMHNLLCNSPLRHDYHQKQLELIRVGRMIGIKLAPPTTSFIKKEEEKINGKDQGKLYHQVS